MAAARRIRVPTRRAAVCRWSCFTLFVVLVSTRISRGDESSNAPAHASPPPAFPGAEGWGRFAVVTTQPAEDAYALVLAEAGATRPTRDSVDARVVGEVADGTAPAGEQGIIDRPADAGAWPELASAPAPTDTDGDGMPDDWETRFGLDPRDPADRNGHALHGSYTNLECHLNACAEPGGAGR